MFRDGQDHHPFGDLEDEDQIIKKCDPRDQDQIIKII